MKTDLNPNGFTVTLTLTEAEYQILYDYTVKENGTRLFEQSVSNFLQQRQHISVLPPFIPKRVFNSSGKP